MFTRDRIAAAHAVSTVNSESDPVIKPAEVIDTVDLCPGRFRSANSLSYWFGAEAAFADEISMKIIGDMSFERHTFAGNHQWMAEGVLERWKETIKFE